MRRYQVIPVALLALLLLSPLFVPGAQAQSITHNYSKAFSLTDWTDVWNVPQFDDLGGTRQLTSIYFELFGEIDTDVRFENMGPSARDAAWSVTGTLTLQRPDLSTIVVTIPTVSGLDSLTAYDSVLDYGGTSGRTYLGLTNSKTESHTSPPPAGDLALFTGTGTIPLPISAVASSGGFSGGNWALFIATDARAQGKIIYYYRGEDIPEPGTVALMALGLVGLAGFALKRRKREEEA